MIKKVGSRAEVYHGVAEKTSGGLTKGDLIKVKGRIKSKALSEMMSDPKKNPLVKINLLVKKGSKKFGADLTKKEGSKSRKNNSNNKKKRTKKSESPFSFFNIF